MFFRQGDIEKMPVDDNRADVVVSYWAHMQVM
ncbi:methyltransferase domain-containing protein [Xiashengella succiniciproducens]